MGKKKKSEEKTEKSVEQVQEKEESDNEINEEEERKQQRKLKKLEKKKRKALEAETARVNKAKKFKLGTKEDTPTTSTALDTNLTAADTEINTVDAKSDEQLEKEEGKEQSGEDAPTKKQFTFDSEKEGRTIFVGNLPTSMTEKALKAMFRRLGSEGESEGNTNKVESIRFRSASRPDIKTSKKVAVIKRMYHEERKNINAYIRFSTKEEAVKCCQANGTKVDGHVLRVDLALNSQTHETNKAVFLGNLAFTTHEDDVRAVFEKCGPIEDVRLVRDSN